MREITILKDGIHGRMPRIIKNVRNVIYIILALSLIAAAIFRRADYLDPSNMVTNIAVIAMVAYPVAVIFSLIVKLLLGLVTCDELTFTSRRMFGFEMLGRPADIAVADIADITSGGLIFKTVTVTSTEGRVYRFIGLRNAERIVRLADHLRISEKESARPENAALDTAALLRNYEGLRKSGIITGAELENVKKQIIGL